MKLLDSSIDYLRERTTHEYSSRRETARGDPALGAVKGGASQVVCSEAVPKEEVKWEPSSLLWSLKTDDTTSTPGAPSSSSCTRDVCAAARKADNSTHHSPGYSHISHHGSLGQTASS